MNNHRYPLALTLIVLLTGTGCQKLNFWRSGPKRDTTQRHSMSMFQSDPRGPTKEQKRDFMLEMAAMFEKDGDTEQAIQAYKAVVEQEPVPAALHRLGVLCVKQGDQDQAITYFHQAIERGGKNAELLCDMGYALYLAQRYPEAEQTLRQAVELDPRLARAHVNYGMLLARTGRPDDALYAFSRAGLTESEARNNLAFALMLDHRFPEAQAQYSGALQADPHNEPARRGLAALHEVQSRAVTR